MCEIIAFPNRKLISKETEARLYGIASDYVDILYDAIEAYVVDEDDFEDLDEISRMVAKVYAEGLEIAIDALEAELDSD